LAWDYVREPSTSVTNPSWCASFFCLSSEPWSVLVGLNHSRMCHLSPLTSMEQLPSCNQVWARFKIRARHVCAGPASCSRSPRARAPLAPGSRLCRAAAAGHLACSAGAARPCPGDGRPQLAAVGPAAACAPCPHVWPRDHAELRLPSLGRRGAIPPPSMRLPGRAPGVRRCRLAWVVDPITVVMGAPPCPALPQADHRRLLLGPAKFRVVCVASCPLHPPPSHQLYPMLAVTPTDQSRPSSSTQVPRAPSPWLRQALSRHLLEPLLVKPKLRSTIPLS
jgi:hypothetical protein